MKMKIEIIWIHHSGKIKLSKILTFYSNVNEFKDWLCGSHCTISTSNITWMIKISMRWTQFIYVCKTWVYVYMNDDSNQLNLLIMIILFIDLMRLNFAWPMTSEVKFVHSNNDWLINIKMIFEGLFYWLNLIPFFIHVPRCIDAHSSKMHIHQ